MVAPPVQTGVEVVSAPMRMKMTKAIPHVIDNNDATYAKVFVLFVAYRIGAITAMNLSKAMATMMICVAVIDNVATALMFKHASLSKTSKLLLKA